PQIAHSFLNSVLRPTQQLRHFPYTTLFRSLAREQWQQDRDDRRLCSLYRTRGRGDRSRHLWRLLRWHYRSRSAVGVLFDGGHGGDRKSTRLNSSHVKISYAVFCSNNKNFNP